MLCATWRRLWFSIRTTKASSTVSSVVRAGAATAGGLAGPPPTPTRSSARQVLNFDDEDDDDAFDCEVESSGLCDAGPLIGNENIAAGDEVAIPFRLNGSEVHYAGRVVRPASTSSSATPQWNVAFPDGDVYVVRHDRLFAVLELGSHSPASAPRQAF